MPSFSQPDFVIIPTQVLMDAKLQPADRILFGYIYWMTKLALMKCIASNGTLAGLTGSAERSIQASLNRLEQQGYIRRIYADENSKHRLEIQCLIAFSAPLRSIERTPTLKRTGGLRSNEHHNKKIELEDLTKQKKLNKEKLASDMQKAKAADEAQAQRAKRNRNRRGSTEQLGDIFNQQEWDNWMKMVDEENGSH